MFRLHSVIAFHHGREFGHGGSSGGGDFGFRAISRLERAC
jgi:hypothetical protein